MLHFNKSNVIFIWLIFIWVSLCFSNCATILYGYKKVTHIDEKWSNEVATSVGIDPGHVIFIDSLQTANLRGLACSSNQSIQPMQLHYVKGDSIVSSYFNCYAIGNLRNLNWRFENPNHNLIEGDCVTSDMGVNMELRDLVNVNTGDLLIVVFSSMFKKQSEQLVKIADTRSTGLTMRLINIDAYYTSIFKK